MNGVPASGETDGEEVITEGATREEVRAELGEPNGYIGSNGHEVYYFDRGDVVFRDGRVSSHTIVSEEEAEERRERTARRHAELRRERDERRAARRAEGLAVKEEHVGDPAFNDLPPRARLAFWETFQHRYPEVDVDLHLAVTREEVREYQAELQRDRRRAEIEAEKADRPEPRYRDDSRVYIQRPYPIFLPRHTPQHPGREIKQRGAHHGGHHPSDRSVHRHSRESNDHHRRHRSEPASPEPPFSVGRDRDPNPGVLSDWGR